jgi:hypothetical protein
MTQAAAPVFDASPTLISNAAPTVSGISEIGRGFLESPFNTLGQIGSSATGSLGNILSNPTFKTLNSGLDAVSGLQSIQGNAQELDHQKKMAELEQQYMQGLISQEEADQKAQEYAQQYDQYASNSAFGQPNNSFGQNSWMYQHSV